MMHFHDTTADDIYRENILDHSANPRNFGDLPDADWSRRELNPSCGDDLTFHVKLDGDRITAVRFSGTGCAVSKAAASMLTERLTGMSVTEAAAMTDDEVFALLGVPVTTSRRRCALLGIKTVRNGIAEHDKKND